MRLTLAALTACFLAAGCAHEVKFPDARFNAPETRGKDLPQETDHLGNALSRPIGRIIPITVQTGHTVELFDSVADLDFVYPDVAYGFSGELALDDQWDLSVRFQPSAPLVFRVKRQLAGSPTARPLVRKILVTANGGIGFGFSNVAATVNSAAGKLSSTGFTFDLGVSAGMRVWRHTLFWLEPYFKIDSVNATLTPSSGSAQSASGSSALFGASLGSRFDWEDVFLMLEVTYARGKFGTADGEAVFPSLAVGMDL